MNIYGLSASYSQPGPTWPKTSIDARRGSLFRQAGERDDAYFRRLTTEVHARIYHDGRPYVVPAHENWILYSLRFVVPSYRNYEFTDYRRALERGRGICTQFANAVFDVLKRQGYKRSMVLFQRHTIVSAKDHQGGDWILDADFGVTLPLSFSEAHRRPEAVMPYYRNLDPETTPLPNWTPARIASQLRASYASPLWGVRSSDPTPQTARVERIAYSLKWPIPSILATAGAVLVWRVRRRSTKRDQAVPGGSGLGSS